MLFNRFFFFFFQSNIILMINCHLTGIFPTSQKWLLSYSLASSLISSLKKNKNKNKIITWFTVDINISFFFFSFFFWAALPSPQNIQISILHSLFVKGDLMNFELGKDILEASQLYPDLKYTSVDQLLDVFLVDPPEAVVAAF